MIRGTALQFAIGSLDDKERTTATIMERAKAFAEFLENDPFTLAQLEHVREAGTAYPNQSFGGVLAN